MTVAAAACLVGLCPPWPRASASSSSSPAIVSEAFACVWGTNGSNVLGPDFVLRNGVVLPRVSLGTAGLPRGSTEAIVSAGLRLGFRGIDSAMATEWYDEAGVGRALASQPQGEGLDVFIATKVHPRDLGRTRTRAAVQSSVARFAEFGATVDLVLLHFPRCFPPVCTEEERRRSEADGGWRGAWAALQDVLREGKVRAVGVSNFELGLLEQLTPRPHVVQDWMDPFHQPREV